MESRKFFFSLSLVGHYSHVEADVSALDVTVQRADDFHGNVSFCRGTTCIIFNAH